MNRTEQLENVLWAILQLVDQGALTSGGHTATRGLEPIRQAWMVLGDAAVARIEGELGPGVD